MWTSSSSHEVRRRPVPKLRLLQLLEPRSLRSGPDPVPEESLTVPGLGCRPLKRACPSLLHPRQARVEHAHVGSDSSVCRESPELGARQSPDLGRVPERDGRMIDQRDAELSAKVPQAIHERVNRATRGRPRIDVHTHEQEAAFAQFPTRFQGHPVRGPGGQKLVDHLQARPGLDMGQSPVRRKDPEAAMARQRVERYSRHISPLADRP